MDLPSRLLYASSEMVYFWTREVSSNHPPEVMEDGSKSTTCIRYLQNDNDKKDKDKKEGNVVLVLNLLEES